MLLCANTQKYNEDGSLIHEVGSNPGVNRTTSKLTTKTLVVCLVGYIEGRR
jgi:hypothetical protein